MLCHFLQEGLHLSRSERTVQSDAEHIEAGNACQESLQRLSAQRPASQVTHGDAQHQRQFPALLFHHAVGGIDGSLGVQRVEDGLHQQRVDSALDQRLNLFPVGLTQFIVGQVAGCGVCHVAAHRTGLVRGTHRTAHKPWPLGGGELVGHPAGHPCALVGHLPTVVLQVIVGLTDALAAEGIGRDKVGTSLQIAAVNVHNDSRARQVEHVVITRHHAWHVAETFAPEVPLRQAIGLNLSSHGTVEYQYPFTGYVVQSRLLHFSIS